MSKPDKAAEIVAGESRGEHEEHHTPGTFTLTLILLLSFAVYYFANWKALADVWHVR
jgi:cytochrome c oxidase subunit 1